MKKWISQLTKARRNSFRKCWRSTINRRLVSAVGRLGMACLILIVVAGIERTPGTNAFFSSTDSIENNSFTMGWWVLPTIAVSSPAAGDEWQVGSSHDIHWNAHSADPSATAGMSVDIQYACDGNPLADIVLGTANDGTFSWTVPEDISNNCKIKISATDSHTLTNSAESDTFEISWMVVLNEFLPNPPGTENGPMPGGEWVELYNNGDQAISVSGWHLYDALDHDLPITDTNTGGTTIPAHGWLVVYRNADADFSLNNDGDTIRLYDGSSGSGSHQLDQVTYGTTVEGKTIARSPDGTGSWVDPVPTPGEKNDPSNDKEDMVKYYEKACFDEQRNILCDRVFLKELGLMEPVAETTVIDTSPEQSSAEPASESEALIIPVDDATLITEESTTDEPADETATDDTVSEELPAPLEENASPVELETEAKENEESSPSATEEDVTPEETVASEIKAVPDDEPVVEESKTEEIKAIKEEVKDEKEAKKEDTTEKEEKDDTTKEKEVSSGKVDDAADNSSDETVETTL